jgi:hypothetical protein
MKKIILLFASILIAAFAYANTVSDSQALISQQCKISAEGVSTLKELRYGNTAIRKEVGSLIQISLKSEENKAAAEEKLNQMIDDKTTATADLQAKFCS